MPRQYFSKHLRKNRLGALTDGIFAIIMTILVLEIKVPNLPDGVNDRSLRAALQETWPLLVAFFASFAILATYWMAHNFIFQNYLRGMDRVLGYLNMVFLMFASLIPFSAHLLGEYYTYPTAIIFYSLNIICIGLALFVFRGYILNRPRLQSRRIDKRDVLHGTIRIFLPPAFALLSIGFSFFAPRVSLTLFAVPVFFNIIPGGLNYLERIIFARNLA